MRSRWSTIMKTTSSGGSASIRLSSHAVATSRALQIGIAASSRMQKRLHCTPVDAWSRPVVLVITGAPASGKTTVGRLLAARLQIPFLSKDLFKETLFDSLGWQDRDWSRRLGGASVALLFRVAAALLEADRSVALESNFYAGGDTSELRQLGERYACQFIQVVCTAPAEMLVERFALRARSGQRHPGHVSEASFDEVLPRLLSERWGALDLPGPVFTVDTANGQWNLDDLALRIVALAERS